jgi:hypothetical protein
VEVIDDDVVVGVEVSADDNARPIASREFRLCCSSTTPSTPTRRLTAA